MLENVLPAIKEKWTESNDKNTIMILQEYGCQVHNKGELLHLEAAKLGLNLKVMKEPPKSLDFNVLDTDAFNSLQKTVYKAAPAEIEDLITVVESAYLDMHRKNIGDAFLLVHQATLNSLMV